jgi:uncharacterized protein YndB with AHSA1/START domain
MPASKHQTKVIAEPGKQELFVIREFEAPRELVFKALTDPEYFVQWFGPGDLTNRLDVFEPVNGGRWRCIQTDKDGNQFAFHGVHHEVLAPERIIGTFEFEGLLEAGHVLLQTIRLEALPGGRTRLMGQSVFQSVEDRDGMVQAGMESGAADSYARLDEILDRLRS